MPDTAASTTARKTSFFKLMRDSTTWTTNKATRPAATPPNTPTSTGTSGNGILTRISTFAGRTSQRPAPTTTRRHTSSAYEIGWKRVSERQNVDRGAASSKTRSSIATKTYVRKRADQVDVVRQ